MSASPQATEHPEPPLTMPPGAFIDEWRASELKESARGAAARRTAGAGLNDCHITEIDGQRQTDRGSLKAPSMRAGVKEPFAREDGMADLIIRNGYVLTMDRERRILADGAVAIAGNRIAAVGPSADILAAHRAEHVIDATDKIVMPGIVDGHNTTPIPTCSAAPATTWASSMSCTGASIPTRCTSGEEEAYWGCLANYATMIKNGTTCFNDPGGYHVRRPGPGRSRQRHSRHRQPLDPRHRAAGQAGAPRSCSIPSTTISARAKRWCRKWHGAADDRIRAWFSLRYVFNVSDELALGIARRSLAGTASASTPTRPRSRARTSSCGRSSASVRWSATTISGCSAPTSTSCIWATPASAEVEWLRQHDVKVAHCPTAAMTGAWGVIANKMIPYMIDRGIAVSLGTDTNGAAGMIDMFRVIYAFAGIHRDMHDDPTLIGAHKALEHATIVGARACLWDDQIGSLEVGKKADLILVDWGELEWLCPARDPVRALVYGTSGNYVDTVVIDGRVVMEGRELTLVDEAELKRKVLAVGRDWPRRAGFAVAPDWPVVA